jgi:outer membrane receptor protein involved in Fe transport
MVNQRMLSRQISLACAGLLVSALLVPGIASAQNSTATLRGHITAPQGQVPTDVVATNTATGFVNKSKVTADGNYTLVGLAPGSYNIVASGNGSSANQTVAVHVGQSLTLNLDTAAAAAAPSTANATNLSGVTVSAASLFETRTSEVAQNVSQAQIANLPQNERNFLDFAQLVPGVTISHDPNSKSFSSGGQSAENVNVFIDGASQRNDILKGGLVGQDSSRGNPFSQEAIAEYRVLTQNYKAEYEQAGTAIITAVTKSGSNEFHGTVYDYFQNQAMISQDSFDKKNHVKKADYKRQQRGFNLGGPIFKDELEFFVNYEERKDTALENVTITDPAFSQYNGTFSAPFHEKSYFGKLSWQPNQDNNIDLSYSDRKDNEVLGFGGTTVYDGRQNRKNNVSDLVLKWETRGDTWTNDALFDSGHYTWSPVAAEPNLVQQNYEGTAILGGASGLQNKSQDQTTVRDDLTFTGLSWHGDHTVKMGVKYASYSLSLLQNNNAVPSYSYNVSQPGGFVSPYRAAYSPFGTGADIHDSQLGVYVQDDWDVTQRLQLNLGVRWDYETNALDKNYVTPVSQYAVLQYNGLQDNISTGHNRKPQKDEIQPRLGFSLDVSKDGDASTTVFGGAGRYFSRTPYDWLSQEPIHSQVPSYTFLFSPGGTTPGTIAWDPRYLTAAGLNQIIGSGQAGFSNEIDTINNNTKAPYTDQFSVGIKQVLGDWTGSLTLSRVLGYRQFSWIWGNRVPGPGFNLTNPPGAAVSYVVLSNAYKKTQSSSVLVGISKPYTTASGWGLDIAYTYQRAHQSGNDNYSLDYADPSGYPRDYVGPKHNLVVSGQVHGPWDTRFSAIATYNSGTPYTYSLGYNGNDATGLVACDYNCAQYINGRYGRPYINLDLAVSKEWRWGDSQALQLRFDVFNALNRDVINGYNGNFYHFGDFATPDPTFGQTTSADPNQTRRFQIGVRYSF